MTFPCPHCKKTIHVYKEFMRSTDAVRLQPKVSIRDVAVTLYYLRGASLAKTGVKFNLAAITINKIVLTVVKKVAPDLAEKYGHILGVYRRNADELISRIKEFADA